MIEGVVNAALEGVIPLSVSGPTGQARDIEAIVDTGYDGFLTLPYALVQELGLPFETSGRATLADGSEASFNVHRGTVPWDTELRNIDVDVSETTPLVGMSLLEWHRLVVDVRDGGRVAIEAAG